MSSLPESGNATLPGRMVHLRRGAVTVEFAVVAPLLFVLVLGIVEYGRAMMAQQTLTAAARAACRVAVVDGATQQEATDRVTQFLAAAGISGHTITFDPDPLSDAAEWQAVTVTVQVAFEDVSWLPVPAYLSGKTLTGFCLMPHE